MNRIADGFSFVIAGDLDPDYENDFWADHDENCHGTIDTEANREEYPEGFVWSCCDRQGDEPGGCLRGKHEALETKKVRRE